MLKAKTLLKAGRDGENPFTQYLPAPTRGSPIVHPSPQFSALEATALSSLQSLSTKLAFVLVAGGIGERLGFPGIKLELEPYATTGKGFLQMVCEYIKAVHERAGGSVLSVLSVPPLVIMTSGVTDGPTRALLAGNGCFGMPEELVTVVRQAEVPAFSNGEAALAFTELGFGAEREVTVTTKPHGHGDVHSLLLSSGTAEKWRDAGVTHAVFLQDSNSLSASGILAALGSSLAGGLAMNTVVVPRVPGEAAGAIAELTPRAPLTGKNGEGTVVVNVEYNQLSPLLAASGPACLAEEPLYQGNTNTFILEMSTYAAVLEGATGGRVPEFVNPKVDGTGAFKSPARLECMMQDYPWLLRETFPPSSGRGPPKVGVTSLPREFCFNPAKNSLSAGALLAEEGKKAGTVGTVGTAEGRGYEEEGRRVREAGNFVERGRAVVLGGVEVGGGPR